MRTRIRILALCWVLAAQVILAVSSGATGSTISLKAKQMPIGEVARLIADEASINIAVGAGVEGNVTLYVNEVDVDVALRLAVDLVGAAYYEEDGVTRLVTGEQYELKFGTSFRDSRISAVLPLQNVVAQQMVMTLTAFKGKSGQVIADPQTNSLLVLDTPERVGQLRELAHQLDLPQEQVAYVSGNTSPSALVEAMTPLLPAGVTAVPDLAGGRVLVRGPGLMLPNMLGMLRVLDHHDSLETRVFPIRYVPPDTLLAALSGMLTPGVGSIYLDTQTRQFIVTDVPGGVEAVASWISALDRPLRQVLVEAKIIQVDFDDETRMGIDWSYVEDKLNLEGSFPSLLSTEPGVRLTIQEEDYQVLFEALSSVGHARLLSSPRVMVADQGTADIHVGADVPYVTVDSREGANGEIQRFERVTIVKTGVKLSVAVKIHDDEMVTMSVIPEVSSVIGTATSNEIPIVETSRAESVVRVPNETTIVLGGLNRVEERQAISGVPILMRIPLLGRLFRSTKVTESQSELAILIKPRIIEDFDRFEAEADSLGRSLMRRKIR